MNNFRVVLIHGNGGGKATDWWFPQVKNFLEGSGIEVVARDFLDNQAAHESIWLPFLKDEIKADEKTILIGHSSGAVASMRYAEQNKIFGSVLVGACYTDTNDETEKESGYYNHPWDFEKIKSNQNWIVQFASTDDPYIPISEPRYIHEKLNTDYYEYTSRGHFMITEFPEILEVIKKKLNI